MKINGTSYQPVRSGSAKDYGLLAGVDSSGHRADSAATKSRVRNDLFNPRFGLDRGRSLFVEAAWYAVKCFFFLSAFPFPSKLKRMLLRCFGAKIGNGVVIKPRVNIHLPWKLTVGDHSWIGEEVCLLSFEPITIGSNCCISQRAYLCAGNHDFSQPSMPYRNEPIILEDGVWIGALSFVSPGVTIHCDAVVAAGSTVTRNLPAGMVCGGQPCLPVKPRWIDQAYDEVATPSFERASVSRGLAEAAA